jgi:hypothetical protein
MFHLPGHKADPFFEGNHIIIKQQQYNNINPLARFSAYLASRDAKFPLSSPLWLTANGSVPTRHFFIRRLRRYFANDIAGQSMRAGGATSLAEHGVPPLSFSLLDGGRQMPSSTYGKALCLFKHPSTQISIADFHVLFFILSLSLSVSSLLPSSHNKIKKLSVFLSFYFPANLTYKSILIIHFLISSSPLIISSSFFLKKKKPPFK